MVSKLLIVIVSIGSTMFVAVIKTGLKSIGSIFEDDIVF
jgi:hypothetical protein